MGSLRVGDDIIVTDILCIIQPAAKLIGTKHTIIQLDCTDFPFQTYPYKIVVAGKSYWVEGIPYSPLILELM